MTLVQDIINEAILLAITPDYVKTDMKIIRGVGKDLNRQENSKNLKIHENLVKEVLEISNEFNKK